MKAVCKCCNGTYDLGMRVGCRAVGVALALGGTKVLVKNPLGAVGFAVTAVGIGHLADVYLLPACPSCGGALHAIDGLLTLLMNTPRRRL